MSHDLQSLSFKSPSNQDNSFALTGSPEFVAAAKSGNLKQVRSLTPTATESQLHQALCAAIQNGRQSVTDYLLSAGVDHTFTNHLPIRLAVRNSRWKLFIDLLNIGGNAHAALQEAATNGNIKVVRYLVANTDADPMYGQGTAWSTIGQINNEPIARLIIYQDERLRRQNLRIQQVTHTQIRLNGLTVAAKSASMPILRLLVKVNQNLNEPWQRATCQAAACGNLVTLKYLIEQNAEVEHYGNHPLLEAVKNKHLDCVSYLLPIYMADDILMQRVVVSAMIYLEEPILELLMLHSSLVKAAAKALNQPQSEYFLPGRGSSLVRPTWLPRAVAIVHHAIFKHQKTSQIIHELPQAMPISKRI